MVVAIDGPAGAGKSTVARAVARALGFTYLDSGAMYRAVGADDAAARRTPAADRAEELDDPSSTTRVLANGEDVTEAIRTPEVSEAASHGGHGPRACARRSSRSSASCSRSGDWVAEGRDIGTVVAPDAEREGLPHGRSPEERARRRAAELGTDVETVLRDQALRDAQDSSREHSPLVRAPTTRSSSTRPASSIDEVVERIVELVRSGSAR